MMRPLVNGPRSLMRTMTVRPLRRLVTRTMVPNGSVRCAAVSLDGENVSPFAVLPAWVQIAATCGLSPARTGTADTAAQTARQIAGLIMRRVPSGSTNRVPARRFHKRQIIYLLCGRQAIALQAAAAAHFAGAT